jgi:adenylate cyclase
MNTLASYLPQDRRRALARGQTLPERTHGSALFTDISGFTALTESLRHTLGSRRGAEEITSLLNQVYTPLIEAIEQYGGSVISFAGDGITCWFDTTDGETAPRAVAAGLALQEAMRPFHTIRLSTGVQLPLSLKVAIATGSARRLVIGDPQIRLWDTLAGETINRMAVGEKLAQQDEIMADEATVEALAGALTIGAWRNNADSGARFAPVLGLGQVVAVCRLVEIAPLAEGVLQPWLNKRVAGRVRYAPLLQTEFRPCTAVFVRFMGIAYDEDTAVFQLDQFIQQVQHTAQQYDGQLIELTIGDKGSFLYLNFGALTAHEDHSRRASKAALTLLQQQSNNPHLPPLQIGINHGIMRVGAYGSPTRHSYGAISGDVNIAARLMQSAAAGQILVTASLAQQEQKQFLFTPCPPLHIKGKTDPLTVYALVGTRPLATLHLLEPNYTLPLIGRTQEQQQLQQSLHKTSQKQGQIIHLSGEPGIGKSRLIAAMLSHATDLGFTVYAGACIPEGTQTPYLVWKPIWQALFGVDEKLTNQQNETELEARLETRLKELAPHWLTALPLLGIFCDTDLPDTEFTQSLETDPRLRQSTRHAMLEDCLKTASMNQPLLLLLEDLHWSDALSLELLQQLGRALAAYPVCFWLVSRTGDSLHTAQTISTMTDWPQFTAIQLNELAETDATQLLWQKLRALYPHLTQSRTPNSRIRTLIQQLQARAQGNPFYLEELINYLHDQGLDPEQAESVADLPDTLHALVLSRIDRLSLSEQSTLKAASIIGRLFRVGWLNGYYPDLHDLAQLKQDLARLDALDITPLDSPEPELTYLFKHIVTHEVAYQSLPYAIRARLHEQLAHWLEQGVAQGVVNAPLAVLAHHYDQSENLPKRQYYLQRAAEEAQENYANQTAIDFYSRLVPLLGEGGGIRQTVLLQRGRLWQRVGMWDKAEGDWLAAAEIGDGEGMVRGEVEHALGMLYRLKGSYEQAEGWLGRAEATFRALDDAEGLVRVWTELGGGVLYYQGKFGEAEGVLQGALPVAQGLANKLVLAHLLNTLGIFYGAQGLHEKARELHEGSLALRQGDLAGMASSLNSLGVGAVRQGDLGRAQRLFAESLALYRQTGNKKSVAMMLNNLGGLALNLGEYEEAQGLYEEGLVMYGEIGDRFGEAMVLGNLGLLAQRGGAYGAARGLYERSLWLSEALEDRASVAFALAQLGHVARLEGEVNTAVSHYTQAATLGEALGDQSTLGSVWLGWGVLLVAQGDTAVARTYLLRSWQSRQQTQERMKQCSSLIGLARLAVALEAYALAAQWLATAVTTLEQLHSVIETEILDVYEEVNTAVQTHLPPDQFASAWHTGTTLTLAQTFPEQL